MGLDVVATRTGLYGGRVRQEGERFTLARKEDKGSWMQDAGKADDVSRVYERHSSPARAEVGPNDALAYAEAGQLTTALNLQLDALRGENAHLHARLAQAEAAAEAAKATRKDDAPKAGAGVKAALKATEERLEEIEKAAEDADVHQSEDEDAVEAKEDAKEADKKNEDDTPRPTRRRRG